MAIKKLYKEELERVRLSLNNIKSRLKNAKEYQTEEIIQYKSDIDWTEGYIKGIKWAIDNLKE